MRKAFTNHAVTFLHFEKLDKSQIEQLMIYIFSGPTTP